MHKEQTVWFWLLFWLTIPLTEDELSGEFFHHSLCSERPFTRIIWIIIVSSSLGAYFSNIWNYNLLMNQFETTWCADRNTIAGAPILKMHEKSFFHIDVNYHTVLHTFKATYGYNTHTPGWPNNQPKPFSEMYVKGSHTITVPTCKLNTTTSA